MMKRTVIGATFLVGFAGAAGVSAGTTVNLKGSDTLFDITTAMLAQCPGTGTPYLGTGSGNGQNAMSAGTQQVAPMSRFLNNGACTGAAGDAGVRTSPAAAEGLVIGLDGVSVVGWNQTFTYSGDAGVGGGGDPVGCNGHTNSTCQVVAPEDNVGAAFNTTINTSAGPYTFTGWRDVLRVLLAGFDHTNNGTGAANWALRDCNSAVRLAVANTYGSFFENNCAAVGGETAGVPCTQIRHIFRRDDFSGTTDTIVGLLNLPSIVIPETAVTLNTTGTATTITNHTGATPFCNAVRPSFVFPVPQPTCPVGSDSTWDPTVCTQTAATPVAPCTATNVANNVCTDPTSGLTKERAVYRVTMQDNDPIRRLCNAREQVCHHGPAGARSLGLVIPINDVPETGVLPQGSSNADRYNATACGSPNHFAPGPIPNIYDNITQGLKLALTGALCPNGDTAPTGGCNVPSTAAATPGPRCLAGVTNAPALTNSTVPVPRINPAGPGVAEGRQYNQHLYNVGATGSAVYQSNAYATPFAVTGAYYRIHSTATLNPVTGRTCQQADMTDQIGCLVEASPCSLGYAGRSAANLAINPNTDAVKINSQSPEARCIQGDPAATPPIPGFKYPLSRKLYLNSLVGFAATNGQELQLAGCETDLAQPGASPATPASLLTDHTKSSSLFLNGFIDIPVAVNGGEPYCEDFNENMLCTGFATNTNACSAAKSNFSAFPATNTVCGNGSQESYEDCDCGTSADHPGGTGGPAANTALCAGTVNGGTVCTTTCRFVN
jgi:hypothetical protein